MIKAFDHIVGNQAAKEYLSRMVSKNTIAQSLLFAGPDGIEKAFFAEAFAHLITGDHNRKGPHPDIHIYRPEGKLGMHSIDALRQFAIEVYLPPFEAQRKIFIIHDAERMLPYSSNALLKTFEEPSPHSIIILLTSNPEALLPTVLSRCSIVRFHSVPQKETAKPLQDPLRLLVLQLLSQIKSSSYPKIVEAAQQIAQLIEQKQTMLSEEAREGFKASYPDGMNSAQQHAIEKEIDGALAMQLARESQDLFIHILGWYRDMQLLHLKGNKQYLFHPDSYEEMNQSLQRGELISLEHVQKVIKKAELSLARSTPLSNCLEHLFLQLK